VTAPATRAAPKAASYADAPADVALALDTDELHGLSDIEAAERLDKFGANLLRRVERPSYVRIAGRQLADPLVGLLLAAAAISAVIGERFALPQAAARVKPLDKALLATERRIFSEVTWHWPELDGAEELDLEIEPWDSSRALGEFTARYERIAALRDVG